MSLWICLKIANSIHPKLHCPFSPYPYPLVMTEYEVCYCNICVYTDCTHTNWDRQNNWLQEVNNKLRSDNGKPDPFRTSQLCIQAIIHTSVHPHRLPSHNGSAYQFKCLHDMIPLHHALNSPSTQTSHSAASSEAVTPVSHRNGHIKRVDPGTVWPH